MLNAQQLDHYRTFGFIVLPDLLGQERSAQLRAEVDSAIRDAYAGTNHERVIDGISGHYIPMASRLTPLSTSLVCDDPVLIDAAEALLGGPVLPAPPEGMARSPLRSLNWPQGDRFRWPDCSHVRTDTT